MTRNMKKSAGSTFMNTWAPPFLRLVLAGGC
jgi:hypothetical protein